MIKCNSIVTIGRIVISKSHCTSSSFFSACSPHRPGTIRSYLNWGASEFDEFVQNTRKIWPNGKCMLLLSFD